MNNIMESVNDIVMLKPTEDGWKRIRSYVDDWNSYNKKHHPHIKFILQMPIPDNDGYIKEQFWYIMRYFEFGVIGSIAPFTDLKINIR